MNEIKNELSTLKLFKKNQFYGVVKTPDGQEFRFDVSSLVKKLVEEKGEKILEGLNVNFNDAKKMYEEAEQEKNPYPVTVDFLNCHQDATGAGNSSAVFYLSHEVCQKALDSLEVIIYTEDSKEEYHQAHSSTIKSGREYEEGRKKARQTNKECAEYWRGYDEGRAEMAKGFEERRHNDFQKSFWGRSLNWLSKWSNPTDEKRK